MKKDANQIALAILNIINTKNIVSYTNCLTKLKIRLKKDINCYFEQLKQLPNVIEVLMINNINEIQILFTSGFANEVKFALDQLINENNEILQNQANSQEQFLLSNNEPIKNNRIQNFLIKFSSIFSPMIIGFIGAAILSGIAEIIQSAYGGNMDLPHINQTALSWYKILNLILEIWKNVFVIIVGWRTCEIFGGSGIIGAMIASIYCPLFVNKVLEIMIIDQSNNHVNFMGIEIKDPLHNWLTVGFHPQLKNLKDESKVISSELTFNYPFGNIIGVLIASACAIHIEKNLRKIKFAMLSSIVIPTITLFLLLMINFFLIIPISGYLYVAVTWFFKYFYLNSFFGFVLAIVFLLMVTFGIHHALTPIYSILLDQTGVNGLFAIVAMSGMAQVGSALAVWSLAEKKSVLRQQIQKTIIPAIFGIGEPILYTVILPRMRFFITTSIASAIAGIFMALAHIWSHTIFGTNAIFTPAGILTIFVITTPNGQVGLASVVYLTGCIVTLIAGSIITLFGYSRIVTIGTRAMKELYCKNSTYKLWQQILWSSCFVTLIGVLFYWIYTYYKLSLDQRKGITQIKIE